jgi:hypothetical protein
LYRERDRPPGAPGVWHVREKGRHPREPLPGRSGEQ